MTAILKHELRSYFHSFTAYVFGAFLLIFVGFGAMIYNLQETVSNFEYVLSYGCMALIIVIPLLTMRVIAEERRQKTDQLLYSLPVSTTQIICGKYLALLAVFLVPMALISLYPLVFSQYGDVYLPTSYGTLIAFFVMGAALTAIGVFLSSLTENQGFAAGIGVAVILFNYFSVSLAEYAVSTALGTVIALALIAVALGFLVRSMTRSNQLAISVGVGLLLVLGVVYFVSPDTLEGLLPEIMSTISLFDRFYIFISGIFDWTGIVYFLTVAVFFLFLSVQSLEKRRYN